MRLGTERKIYLCIAFGVLAFILNGIATGMKLRGDIAIFLVIFSGILLGLGIDFSIRARPNSGLQRSKIDMPEDEPPEPPRQIVDEPDDDDHPVDIGELLEHIPQMNEDPLSDEGMNLDNTPDEIPLEDLFGGINEEIKK